MLIYICDKCARSFAEPKMEEIPAGMVISIPGAYTKDNKVAMCPHCDYIHLMGFDTVDTGHSEPLPSQFPG